MGELEEAQAELAEAHDALMEVVAERDAFKHAAEHVRSGLAAALVIWTPERDYHRDRAERKGYSHDEAAAAVYNAAIKVATDAIAALDAPRGGT